MYMEICILDGLTLRNCMLFVLYITDNLPSLRKKEVDCFFLTIDGGKLCRAIW